MFDVQAMVTEDISIRAYEKKDISRTVHWLNNPEIKKSFGLTYDIDPLSHTKWLKKAVKESVLIWAIEYKMKHVGDLIVRLKPKHFNSYLQIYIGETSAYRKGVASTSMKMCLSYLFETLHYHRVELHVSPENYPAKNLYKYLGFQYEGLEKESVYQEGRFYDQERWAFINDGEF